MTTMLDPIKEQNGNHDNTDQKLSPTVVGDDPQILARYSVLYLGTAIPAPDQHGIDSVQLPLSKRYPINGEKAVRGIEAWLSINKNDLQIQFAHDPSVIIYYPIRSLVYCVSVRYATRTETGDKFPDNGRFVRLDSPEATQIENLQNPPLFAVIFHRTRSLPINECHCFIAKTKRIALELVQACFDAYQITDFQQDFSKVPLYFKIDFNNESELKEIDYEISLIPALDEEQNFDYQINHECAGYFYKLDQISIDYWQIFERNKSHNNRSSSSLASRRRRRRHHSSKTPISDIQELPSESIASSSTEQLSINPYAPAPNVIRVERIKDVNTGRDIFVRWVQDKSEVPEQKLPDEIEHLELNDKQSKKFKKKSRKQRHRDRKINDAVLEERDENLSTVSFIPQQLPIGTPGTFYTIQPPSQPNFESAPSPFWFFTM